VAYDTKNGPSAISRKGLNKICRQYHAGHQGHEGGKLEVTSNSFKHTEESVATVAAAATLH
jgi:hypothetical protein